jgi:hypothetical protein
MKPVSATMQWKGRKLLCNGVCVAKIVERALAPGFVTDVVREVLSFHRFERTARRAVNRRFKLPLDFGDQ